jgi:hypothetical protein
MEGMKSVKGGFLLTVLAELALRRRKVAGGGVAGGGLS